MGAGGRMRNFSASLAAGFILSLALFILLVREWEADSRFKADPALLTRFHSEWYDPSTRTPSEANRRREFWLAENDWRQGGVALRLLENRSLLESFFPGYGEAASDSGLWDTYFRDDTGGWSPVRSVKPELSADGEYAIRARLFGAMELFARHGADVIVLGSSKTFCAVIPGLLAEAVKGAAGPDPKVLMIGKDAFFVPGFSRAAEALSRRIPRKARLAIVTVSWHDWGDETSKLGERFERFAKGEDPSPEQSPLRSLLDWRAWVDVDLFRHVQADGSPWIRLGENSYVFPDEDLGRALAIFPRADERNPAAVKVISEKALNVGLTYGPPQGKYTFRVERSREEIEKKIASARLLADRILLFFPPEPPEAAKAYPSGFLPGFRAMLKGLAAPDVAVVEEDWSSYGLTPLDHVHAGWAPGRAYWQSDHVNYAGARKVTEKLGQLARAALR
ncbi:MAG TPA: hypothetical protein VM598_12540 [Bdellovibrionota bacterium]|nr:hypothetical protein [Bdellovibrionota bacterium]